MSSEDARVALDLLHRRVAHAEAEARRLREGPGRERRPGVDPGKGNGGSQVPDVGERLGRLEAMIGGLRHSQSTAVSLAVVLFLILAGLVAYGFARVDSQGQRLDHLSTEVTALPSRMTGDLQNLIKTFAESIAMTKRSPEVIVLPAPRAPATDSTR